MSSASSVDQHRVLDDAVRWALPRLGVYLVAAVAGAAIFAMWATVYTYVWSETRERQIEYPAPYSPAKPARIVPSLDSQDGLSPPIVRLDNAPIHLSAGQAQIVREILNPTGAKGQDDAYGLEFKIGEMVRPLLIPILPDSVVAQVSALKGFRYTIDKRGRIVLIHPSTYRVVAIIEHDP